MFGVGLILGGGAVGAILGVLGGLFTIVPLFLRFGTLLFALILGVLYDMGVMQLNLPQNKRLVPHEVLTKGPVAGPLQFGFEMGTGLRTFLPSASPHLVAASILLAPAEFWVATVVGMSFGIGRFLLPLSRVLSGDGEAWDRGMNLRKAIFSRVAVGPVSLVIASQVFLGHTSL